MLTHHLYYGGLIMKEWNFKYMNEAQIAEIDKLWNDGHSEALTAYGLECGNAAINGWNAGLREGIGKAIAKSCLLTTVSVVVVGGTIYIGKKVCRELKHRKILKEGGTLIVDSDEE
jgi:hypothetical protein